VRARALLAMEPPSLAAALLLALLIIIGARPARATPAPRSAPRKPATRRPPPRAAAHRPPAAATAAAAARAWRARVRRDAVLLVGPSDAGKTTLWLALTTGAPAARGATVASMQPNEARVRLRRDGARARPARLVDLPGHPRLRGRFAAAAPAAAGVIFVVDAVDFMPRKAEAAAALFDVLAHPAVASRRLPVLLFCGKADYGPKAHSVDFVRKQLERELEALRGTRGALAGAAVGGGGRGAAAGGGGGGGVLETGGAPFSFAALAGAGRGARVEAAAGSAVDAGGAEAVEDFIRRCVPA
jgi:signal recognition particle receptor subunit beta